MSSESEFIYNEIPDVAEIVRNECWLEGQRRGCPVEASDDYIRQRVADIILDGAGAEIRQRRGSVSAPPRG